MSASFTSTTFTPDNLIAGEFPILTRTVTILSGQTVARGAVLGKITTGGKYVLSLAAAEDGSQAPDAVLVEAVDASAADKVGIAYFAGAFSESALVLGTGHTAASIREGLRGKGIHLIPTKAS
jgi:hypothetical protein